MTALTRTPQNTNVLQPTKFLLNFDRIKSVQYFCQTANIPGMSLDQAVINTPSIDIHAPGTKLNYNSFNVDFIIDEQLNSWMQIHNWLKSIASPTGTEERNRLTQLQNQYSAKKNSYSDGTLTILSGLNNPELRVVFYNLFPISLSDISFDTKLSADNITTATATFVYDYFDFVTP
jgi:hypothetical protein